MERLCKAAGGTTLDSAYAHEGKKVVGQKPTLASLRREVALDVCHFATGELFGNWNVGIGLRKIAFVLRNLVLENEVVAPRVPC